MNALVGALRVNLGLDSAQFQRGLSQAQRNLADLRTRMTASASGAAAFGSALVVMARTAANEIDRAVKAARRLDASLAAFRALQLAAGEAGVNVETLADNLQTMNRELAEGGPQAQAALQRLGLSARELLRLDADERLARIADRVKELGLSSADASLILQQLGVRNREMVLALMGGGGVIRKARQDVEDYGLALSSIQTDAIERANDQIGRLSLVWQYLGQQLALRVMPALGRMAQAMTDSLRSGGLLRTTIDVLVGSLERLSTYAVTFAAFLAGRYVAALLAARIATFAFAGSLLAVRAALIRTGFGALIVGAGELVYQFSRLVRAAGGFGNALGLLQEVGAEVWDRMRLGVTALGARIAATFYDAKADAAMSMQSAVSNVVAFGNTAANTFEGAYEAMKSIWGLLPAAIGDLAFRAANNLIDGVEAMLNGVVARVNSFLDAINDGLESLGLERTIALVPDIDLGEIENRFAGAADAAADAARTAFDRAFEDNPLAVPELGFTGIAIEARDAARFYRDATSAFVAAAALPLRSVQALAAAIRNADGEMDSLSGTTATLTSGAEALRGVVAGVHAAIADGIRAMQAGPGLLGQMETIAGRLAGIFDGLGSTFFDRLARAVPLLGQVGDFFSSFAEQFAPSGDLASSLANASDGIAASRALLIEKEGFREKAYWDVNAWRAGYGSDTTTDPVTGAVSRVTRSTVVSIQAAEADLRRRIVEFQNGIIALIGAERWASFLPAQQAALTSIAYNYGSIGPGGANIADVVRSGSTGDIVQAISGLAGHNDGINRNRRLQEAAIFGGGIGVPEAAERAAEAANDRAEAEARAAQEAAEYRDTLRQTLADERFILSLADAQLEDREVALALRRAEQEAARAGTQLTAEERAEIERITRARFAEQGAQERRNALLQQARDLEAEIARLQDREGFLKGQVSHFTGIGDAARAQAARDELEGVRAELDRALQGAIAFWQTIGGPESASAIQNLEQTRTLLGQVGDEVQDVADRARTGRDALTDLFMAGMKGADSFKQALGRLVMRMAEVQMQNAMMGIGQTGWGGNIFGTLGSLLTPIGRNANGTASWRGGLTWLGERGAELVDLPAGTRIWDAQTSRRMAADAGLQETVVRVEGGDLTLGDGGQIMARVRVMVDRGSAAAQAATMRRLGQSKVGWA